MPRLVTPLLLAAAALAAAGAVLAAPAPISPLPPDPTHVDAFYAWPQGGDLVLAMTVNPGAAPLATAGTSLRFSTSTLYVFHVAAHGTTTDLKTYVVQFADAPGGAQWARVRGTGHGSGKTDDLVGRVNTVADAGKPRVIRSGDGKVQFFAGPRDDPSFGAPSGGYALDYTGFAACYGTAGTLEHCWLGECDRLHADVGCRNGPTQAGYPDDVIDERGGLNADAIVLEVPAADFGADTKVDVWAATVAQ